MSEVVSPKGTLLLVDDQASVLMSLRHVLEFGGFRVLVAGSGVEALELAATQIFGGALIDVHMPGMTGVELCVRLGEILASKGGGVTLWLMTGAPTAEIRQRAAAIGVRGVLVKPFELASLLQEIESGLNSSRQSPVAGDVLPMVRRC